MKLITDNAALAKAIKSIAVRGQKLDHDIHVAGTVMFNYGHSVQHRWLYKDWSNFYVMDDFGNLRALRHRFERMHYSLLGY